MIKAEIFYVLLVKYIRVDHRVVHVYGTICTALRV